MQQLLSLYQNLARVELKLQHYKLVIKNAHLAQAIAETATSNFVEAKVEPALTHRTSLLDMQNHTCGISSLLHSVNLILFTVIHVNLFYRIVS